MVAALLFGVNDLTIIMNTNHLLLEGGRLENERPSPN